MNRPSLLGFTGLRRLSIGAALMAASLAAPMAIAQAPAAGQPVRPPKIEAPGPAKTWLAMLVAIGVGALAIGVAVIPSQRTHQD